VQTGIAYSADEVEAAYIATVQAKGGLPSLKEVRDHTGLDISRNDWKVITKERRAELRRGMQEKGEAPSEVTPQRRSEQRARAAREEQPVSATVTKTPSQRRSSKVVTPGKIEAAWRRLHAKTGDRPTRAQVAEAVGSPIPKSVWNEVKAKMKETE
jgi:hypothetical protein